MMAIRKPVYRIGAYLIDYCFIAAYIGALVAVNLLLAKDGLEPVSSLGEKVFGHLVAFSTLTVPVWLYFTLQEYGPKRATIGKRLLGLSVARNGGERPAFSSIALRNGVKFLPWEMSHAAIWYVPGRPFLDPMPVLNLVVCSASVLVAIIYVLSLFLGNGRTPYDRLSGTFVAAS